MTRLAAERIDPVKLPDDVRRNLEHRMVDAFEHVMQNLPERCSLDRQHDLLRKAALGVIRGVPPR